MEKAQTIMEKTQTISGGWIYNLDDYRRIFTLTEKDFSKNIFNFPGCVSSVNAEMFALKHRMVSGDQFYDLSSQGMRDHAMQVLEIKEKNLKNHRSQLNDTSDENLRRIFKHWQDNIEKFLHDYPQGKKEQRYCAMKLPKLSIESAQFDLALCSDLLFHTQAREGYSPEQLVDELTRIANEVRVYPLLDENGKITGALGPVILSLHQRGFGVEVREVPYRMRKGGNAMLRIWSKECILPSENQ